MAKRISSMKLVIGAGLAWSVSTHRTHSNNPVTLVIGAGLAWSVSIGLDVQNGRLHHNNPQSSPDRALVAGQRCACAEAGLGCARPGWAVLGRAGLRWGWAVLHCAGLCWAGPGSAALGCAVLCWAGLISS